MSNSFDLLKYSKTLKQANEEVINQYSTILPEFIIKEWKERGFASYTNGFLITTDPSDFYDIMEDWVEDPDNCHVIMRSAFGTVYYLKNGDYYSLDFVSNQLNHLQKNFEFVLKFSLVNKSYLEDGLFKDIYDKTVKRLGAPEYNEIYAFVPAISMGGDYNPDTIQKVKLREHAAILAQMKS